MQYQKQNLIDKIGLQAGFMLTHFSNGRFKAPNSGINSFTFNVGLNYNFDEDIYVIDDLGHGKIKIKYTIGALFAQANSHTIHHYAIINYNLDALNISIEDSDFGYNPTTLKEGKLN